MIGINILFIGSAWKIGIEVEKVGSCGGTGLKSLANNYEQIFIITISLNIFRL